MTKTNAITLAFVAGCFFLAAINDARISQLRRDLDGLEHQAQRRLNDLEEINRRETYATQR